MKGLPTNEELRSALKNLNLPQSGTKSVLLERLGWAELIQDPALFEEDLSPEVWELNYSTVGPVIKRIPKASRIQACKIFTEILTDVTNKNDKKSWERCLQYPRYCLRGTLRGGKKKKSQATVINNSIDFFIKETLPPDKYVP